MNERNFQTKFTRWARHNLKKTTATELKVVRGGRYYLKQLKEHQLRNLFNTKHKGIYFKIADVGPAQKPWDGAFIKGDAWVVIHFIPTKNTYAIDIDEYMLLKGPGLSECDLKPGWLIEVK
jgi:hypothetical protein